MLFTLMFVGVSFASAQSASVTLFTPDEAVLAGALITLQIGPEIQRGLLSSNDFEFTLPDTDQEVLIIVDFLNTPAKDYFGQEKFMQGTLESKRDVLVFPIGHVQGNVVDGNGNLVENAVLVFECQHSFSIVYPAATDSVGSFSVPNMPVGTCRITGRSGRQVGTADITVRQGEITTVEIPLMREVSRSNLVYVLFGILILGGVGGLALGVWRVRRGGATESHIVRQVPVSQESHVVEPSRNEPIVNYSSHADVIMQTLSDKERAVVQYLLEHKEAAQAQIRHECKIPRTSLTRLFQNLERKKIVEVEKMGKMVKVRLTQFFLGKF